MTWAGKKSTHSIPKYLRSLWLCLFTSIANKIQLMKYSPNQSAVTTLKSVWLKTCWTTGRCRKTFMLMFKKLSITRLSNRDWQTLQILWKHCYFSLMANLDLLRTLFRWDNLITVNFKRLGLEMKPHMKKLRDFHILSWTKSLSIKMCLLKFKIKMHQARDRTSR